MKKNIFKEAEEIIYGDREQTYGDPGKNLKMIAGIWSTYLGVEVTAQDVCNMMIQLKTVRLKNTPAHRDSMVDVMGYAGLMDRITK